MTLHNMQKHSKKQLCFGRYKLLFSVGFERLSREHGLISPASRGQTWSSLNDRCDCCPVETLQQHISSTTHGERPLIISYTKQSTEVILQGCRHPCLCFYYVVHVLITNCSTLLTCTSFYFECCQTLCEQNVFFPFQYIVLIKKKKKWNSNGKKKIKKKCHGISLSAEDSKISQLILTKTEPAAQR